MASSGETLVSLYRVKQEETTRPMMRRSLDGTPIPINLPNVYLIGDGGKRALMADAATDLSYPRLEMSGIIAPSANPVLHISFPWGENGEIIGKGDPEKPFQVYQNVIVVYADRAVLVQFDGEPEQITLPGSSLTVPRYTSDSPMTPTLIDSDEFLQRFAGELAQMRYQSPIK